MQHHFDTDIAQAVGILPAVFINHMEFWIEKNRANKVNFNDGCYWTYNSISAMKKLFPYVSERQIRTAIDKLIEGGYIKTGNYNKSAYDRTLWYAFTEKGESLLQKGQNHLTETENGTDRNDKPIPDNIPDNDANKNHISKRFKKPTVEEIEGYCRERNNGISSQKFYDYYESKGWVVGKSPMKDWKACVRTWENNRKEQTGKRITTTHTADAEVVEF